MLNTRLESGGDKLRRNSRDGVLISQRGPAPRGKTTSLDLGSRSQPNGQSKTLRNVSTAAPLSRRGGKLLPPTAGSQNQHPNAQTLNSGEGNSKSGGLAAKKAKVPAYMQSLNQQEKAENFKILDNMNKKISYKKNPRFKINKAPILFTKVMNSNSNVLGW